MVIALYYLHQVGYVHRDVSTGNLMMYRGKTKLLDLEYIKAIEPNEVSRSNEILKTVSSFVF